MPMQNVKTTTMINRLCLSILSYTLLSIMTQAQISVSGNALRFGYDAVGNRVSRTVDGIGQFMPVVQSELSHIAVYPTVTTGVVTIDAWECDPMLLDDGIGYLLTDLQGTSVVSGTIYDFETSLTIAGNSGVYFLYFFYQSDQRCVKLIKT